MIESSRDLDIYEYGLDYIELYNNLNQIKYKMI